MDPQNKLPSMRTLTGADIKIKIVDIGANFLGEAPPYAGLLSTGDAEIIGFEPNLGALATLNEMKGPHETYLPHAVGDGGRHTLHFCAAAGMTSLLEPNPHVLNLFGGFPEWGRVVATEEIDTVRLDDVKETSGVHFIKIDIQGAELMVFRNAENRLLDTLVIQTEAEFMQMYIDQPLFTDIDLFLRSNGFMFHRFFPAVSRVIKPMVLNNDVYAGLSQMLWADAIFIRDITRLDLLSDAQLLNMGAILHECYRSYDVTMLLLNEYDRRNKTTLGGDYLTGLQEPTRQLIIYPAA